MVLDLQYKFLFLHLLNIFLVDFLIYFILDVAFDCTTYQIKKTITLKLRSNFLSKCKPLGTIIQFILFYKCSHFNPSYSFSSSVTVDFTRFFSFLRLFPLDRRRGFAGDVVDDSVDAFDFVDDAVGYDVKDFVRDAGPFGSHEVGGSDAAQRECVRVGAAVAHDADRTIRGEYGEILVHFAIPAGIFNFFPPNGVGVPQGVEFFFGDFAHDADAQAGSREGLPPDEVIGEAEFFTKRAHFIFEEVA